MTLEEAKKTIKEITDRIHEKSYFTEEEEFQINELSKYICEQEKSGNYASFVGNKCMENDKCDLALYYFELSIQYGYLHSYKYAGDIYYNGWAKCGKDLKKAFEYYTKAIETKVVGDGTWENPITDVHNDAKMSLAKMYKNGEYVEKDYEEYKRLINEVYEEVKDKEDDEQTKYLVLKEKVAIAIEEKDEEAAADYLVDAMYSSEEFYFQTFMVEELYTLEEFANTLFEIVPVDIFDVDFPEIFYLLKKPCKIKFVLDGKEHYIESLKEKDAIVIKLEDQWFRNVVEMIDKAKIDGQELKFNIENIDYWEVL